MHKISHRKLEPQHLEQLAALRKLYSEVFQTDDVKPASHSYLELLLKNNGIIFYVAELDNQVIGGLTAYILPSIYGEYSELYIYDMAIAVQHQRHGIGSRLLVALQTYCKTKNIHGIFVQADTVDIHARNFYKKNGGTELDVRHYDFKV